MRRWEKVVMRYHQWETSPQMMQKIRPTAGDIAQNTEPMHWLWRFPLVIFLCYVVACKNVKCSAPSKMLMLTQAPNSDWAPTTYKRQAQHHVLPNCGLKPAPSSCEPTPRFPPELLPEDLIAQVVLLPYLGGRVKTPSIIRVPKLFLPPTKIRIFGLKKAKFGKKYAFLGTYRPCRFIWCPVGWWLWRAGCISQDT